MAEGEAGIFPAIRTVGAIFRFVMWHSVALGASPGRWKIW
jgi:hypothetical protein